MVNSETKNSKIITSIAPWFSVRNAVKSSDFYKSAFDAVETYRLETPDGLIVKLALDGAEFWLSGGYDDGNELNNPKLGGDSLRMILTVSNPDVIFEKALQAGASQVFPVGEDHGWRLGRLVDPFGLHWEIGHPI
jgi:PhnB protein